MDFDFSEEQYLFRDTIRDFLSRSAPPTLGKSSENEPDVWLNLAELGIFSILIPEESGGLGLGLLDAVLPCEEFGKKLFTVLASTTLAATHVVSKYGTNRQKEDLLPRIGSGEAAITVPFTDVRFGEWENNKSPIRIEQKNDKWILNGPISLVPNASNADYLMFSGRFPGADSASLLTVPLGREGICLNELEAIDLSDQYNQVTFTDCVVSSEDVLYDVSEAGSAANELLEIQTGLITVQLVGVLEEIAAGVTEYAKERVQFGKPIGSFQAVKHKCSDIAVAVESAQSAVYYAFWAASENTDDASKAISIAKSFCSETSAFVCKHAFQIYGGIGFTWEFNHHLFARRAKFFELIFGDSSFHREKVLWTVISERDKNIS